eukprot:SAG11_NODE_10044_length_861_cov_1.077428_1_plen_175_part_00
MTLEPIRKFSIAALWLSVKRHDVCRMVRPFNRLAGGCSSTWCRSLTCSWPSDSQSIMLPTSHGATQRHRPRRVATPAQVLPRLFFESNVPHLLMSQRCSRIRDCKNQCFRCRAAAALVELGLPVFQGGLSTLLAVVLIGFAKSKGFEVLAAPLLVHTALCGIQTMCGANDVMNG